MEKTNFHPFQAYHLKIFNVQLHGYKIIHNFLCTIQRDLQWDGYDISGHFWNPYKYWI